MYLQQCCIDFFLFFARFHLDKWSTLFLVLQSLNKYVIKKQGKIAQKAAAAACREASK